MILSKNAGSLPDERAHAIKTTAIAAAARITRAYSAVVWPRSARVSDLPEEIRPDGWPETRRTDHRGRPTIAHE